MVSKATHFAVLKNGHTYKNTHISAATHHRKKKYIKMSFFKSSENIQKKEGGSDRSGLDNQSSSVTLNELAMKARKIL